MKRLFTLLFLLPMLAAVPLTAQTTRTNGLPSVLIPQNPTLPFDQSSSITADATANTYDPTLASRLQSAIEKTLAKVDVRVRRGVIASVVAPGLGQWTGAAGLSDTITPARTDMRFQIASISKTFTAATIFQLAEEGKLSLDDSISRWIPSHPNIDSTITVRQLLAHTSGIYDYLNDDPNGAVMIYAYLTDPNRVWRPQDILGGFVGPANFKPGKGVRYSNTNYLLLGMIIESITGNTVAEELRNRLLSKLDLRETWSAWSDTVDGDMMHGWSIGFDDTNPLNQTDISHIPSTAILSAAWTAGGMVSTAGDLARWADALYGGRVISSTSLDQMLTFRSGGNDLFYGLGAFRQDYGSQLLYGHTGGLLGYNSWMFSAPDDSISIAILVNSFHTAIDNGLYRFRDAILDELYRPPSTNSVNDDTAVLICRITPNPLADRATIEYSVPTRSHVAIEVVDAVGSRVAMVKDEVIESGRHAASIELQGVPEGTYFCVVNVGGDMRALPVQVVR